MSNYNFNFTKHGYSPCKNCGSRKLGCHDTCNQYQCFVKQNEVDNKKEQIRKEAFANTPWNCLSTLEKMQKRRK